MKRLAVVLFNLGGPDSLDAVEPFLYNLFMDKAIINAPLPVRWLLAKLISKRRAPLAQDIYKHLGGKSPLLELTHEQAEALKWAVGERMEDVEIEVFVSMRYWHPMSAETVQAVKRFAPDQVVLLPLYPQYSTTTTQSSFEDWSKTAVAAGLNVPTKRICCFPTISGWVDAQARLLKEALDKAEAQANGKAVRVLFSAHGLPKKTVDQKGDPYPQHVEAGAQAIADAVRRLGADLPDWLVSYQSRVGPLEWIGPSTEDEIRHAADDDTVLVVLPVAFVSEHSETLVELDIEYKHLANDVGVPGYVRVPAVGIAPEFIQSLAEMVTSCLDRDAVTCPAGGTASQCPGESPSCGLRLSP